MDLREQLMDDLKEGLRQKDECRKTTIRSVIAAIKKAETELDANGERIKLDNRGILAVISKEAKIRQESILEFRKGNREDLVVKEEAELSILETYLPEQMTREEIEVRARAVIEQVGASNPRDMGKVMKPLMAELRGEADGRLVSQVVQEQLSG